MEIIKKKKTKPPSKTTLGGYLTGFESSGGRISGFIVWGMKYSTLNSLWGYVDFFLYRNLYYESIFYNQSISISLMLYLYFKKNRNWWSKLKRFDLEVKINLYGLKFGIRDSMLLCS